jgi:hypothetical protein
VTPGSLSCVDETILPHYGKIANDAGKLINIPDKPWDFGMLAYPLCQRFFFSQLPVCLAFRLNCLSIALTPGNMALALLADINPLNDHLCGP